MKHLIAFLGYNQSRINHPVYRQYVHAPFARRNTALVFLSRPLEERDLVHEINNLRKRENGPDELSFHLCADLSDPAMGPQIIQGASMIRRIFDSPTYVYGLLPDLQNCSEELVKSTWKSLTAINNGVTEYPHLQLISHCFLYHDTTQVSLARFLFNLTQQPEALDIVERSGYLGKLLSNRKTGDVSFVPEFPKIFSTFNASALAYPEEEVRYYIHQHYLKSLLELSRPASNAVSMEKCNEHVEQLISSLPLSDHDVTLTNSTFIELQSGEQYNWQDIETFWSNCSLKEKANLEDRPSEEWLSIFRNGMELNYQNRYRELGVELFYNKHKSLTPQYCQIMLDQLRQGIMQIMFANPYPPETKQDIVRSLVNSLQQKALAFTMQDKELKQTTQQEELQLSDIKKQWNALGFFDRMRGRNKILFDEYQKILVSYYIHRTEQQGAEFAAKLLNELIPQLSAMNESEHNAAHLCQDAYEAICSYITDNEPELFTPSEFELAPIHDAALAIATDREALKQDYTELQKLLYGEIQLVDFENLIQMLRDALTDKIDSYIKKRMAEGSMPQVLGVPVTERLIHAYREQQGISTAIAKLKNEAALSLRLKEEGGHSEQYLLISPKCDGMGSYIRATDQTSMQMLHFMSSIRLTELEGFSGQRMFVEPSIF